MHPATAVDEIRAGLTEQGGFLPYVFGVQHSGERGSMMRQHYSATPVRYTQPLTTAGRYVAEKAEWVDELLASLREVGAHGDQQVAHRAAGRDWLASPASCSLEL